jgi:hypothetical protein
MRRLKLATGLWKIQPQWVATSGKQTTNNKHIIRIQDFNPNGYIKIFTNFKNQFACGKTVAVHTKLVFHFNVRPVHFVFICVLTMAQQSIN